MLACGRPRRGEVAGLSCSATPARLPLPRSCGPPPPPRAVSLFARGLERAAPAGRSKAVAVKPVTPVIDSERRGVALRPSLRACWGLGFCPALQKQLSQGHSCTRLVPICAPRLLAGYDFREPVTGWHVWPGKSTQSIRRSASTCSGRPRVLSVGQRLDEVRHAPPAHRLAGGWLLLRRRGSGQAPAQGGGAC